jgi:hypothetical protein
MESRSWRDGLDTQASLPHIIHCPLAALSFYWENRHMYDTAEKRQLIYVPRRGSCSSLVDLHYQSWLLVIWTMICHSWPPHRPKPEIECHDYLPCSTRMSIHRLLWFHKSSAIELKPHVTVCFMLPRLYQLSETVFRDFENEVQGKSRLLGTHIEGQI